MNFVFGDSYGGVQAAEQAADAQDRRFLLSLLTAEQNAERLRQSQRGQALMERQFLENTLMNRARLGESRRQWGLGFEEARKQRRDALDLNIWGKEIAEDQLALQKNELSFRKELEKGDRELESQATDTFGQVLARSFKDLLSRQEQAEKLFQEAQDRKLDLDRKGELLSGSGQVRLDPKSGAWLPMSPEHQRVANRLNQELREALVTVDRANEARKLAGSALSQRLSQANANGFVQDTTTGEFVHPRTQRRYGYTQAAQQNSPVIPIYDPKQRRLVYPGQAAPVTAPIPAAAPNVTAPPIVVTPPVVTPQPSSPLDVLSQVPAGLAAPVIGAALGPTLTRLAEPTPGLAEFEQALKLAQRSPDWDEREAPKLRLAELIQRYTGFPGSRIGSSVVRRDPVKEIAKGLFGRKPDPAIIKMVDEIPPDVMTELLRNAADPQKHQLNAPVPVAPNDPFGVLVPR